MTFIAPRGGLADETARLLEQLGVGRAAFSGGTLAAISPITGRDDRPGRRGRCRGARSRRRTRAFLAWRDVPAPRRGELVRLLGEELRAHKAELGRLVSIEAGKIASRRPRRSPGDDRHLRFRGRPLAPALRPDHRHRAAGPPHDGDLASARRRRHHLRLQLPGRGLGVERGAGAGLRRQPGLEAVREDAAHRARRAGACSSAPRRVSAMRRHGLVAASFIGGREVGEALVDHPRVALRLRDRLDARWAAPSAPRVAARFARASSSSAATMPRSSAPRPISTWRCAASPSPRWARPASAAPPCAACSCTTASTTRFVPRLKAAYGSVAIGDPLRRRHAGRPADRRAPPSTAMQRALDDARGRGRHRHGGERVDGDADAYYVRPALVEMPQQDGPGAARRPSRRSST